MGGVLFFVRYNGKCYYIIPGTYYTWYVLIGMLFPFIIMSTSNDHYGAYLCCGLGFYEGAPWYELTEGRLLLNEYVIDHGVTWAMDNHSGS